MVYHHISLLHPISMNHLMEEDLLVQEFCHQVLVLKELMEQVDQVLILEDTHLQVLVLQYFLNLGQVEEYPQGHHLEFPHLLFQFCLDFMFLFS